MSADIRNKCTKQRRGWRLMRIVVGGLWGAAAVSGLAVPAMATSDSSVTTKVFAERNTVGVNALAGELSTNPEIVTRTLVRAAPLAGLWASASTPTASCPRSHPYLTRDIFQLNPIRSWGGVQVTQGSSGLDAAIEPVWSNYPFNKTYGEFGDYATGIWAGSVTQWETQSNTFSIVLHCTNDSALGYKL